MENMREKILSLVQDAKKGTLTRAKIEEQLQLKTSSDFVQFDRTMQALEEEFQLVRNKQNKYETRTQAGFIEGKLKVNRKGVGYIDREGEESLVINAEDQADALDGDRVLVKWQPSFGNEAEVVRVLERARDHVIGTYFMTTKGLKCIPDDEKLNQRLFTVRTDKDFTPLEGLRVLLKIEQYGKPLKFYVEKVIGHKDDPGVDITAVLLKYDIVSEFPEDVMEQAQALPQEVLDTDYEGRSDIRDVVTVTIDGDDSKDFDDAVSVKKTEDGWNLKVSIADVSHYVPSDTPLDKEAYKRGTSTYVIDRVVPMFPHILSNGICSLNPQVDRLAITCDMMVNPDGTVESYDLYPSIINSDERMTYKKVNAILEGDSDLIKQYEHLGTLFTDLRDCADAIRSARVNKGAIDFDTDEAEIIVDENGHPIEIRKRERGHAERMIEDCMIAANVCVADYMNVHEIPALYRIHEDPKIKKLKTFESLSWRLGHPFKANDSLRPKDVQMYLSSIEGTPEYPILSTQLLRCMQKAKYDATCVGHFGLAEEEYLHFTSPIRRYPDLEVHRMLRKYVFEKGYQSKQLRKDEELMKEMAEQCSARERASTDAEFEVDDMKKAEYMLDHIGEEFDGMISTVTAFGFYVELDNTVEGLVHINNLSDDYYHFDEEECALFGSSRSKAFRVGQTIRIKVLAASKENGTIDFAPAKMEAKRYERPQHSHKPKMAGRNARSYDRKDKPNGRTRSNERRTGFDSRGTGKRFEAKSGQRTGERSGYATKRFDSDESVRGNGERSDFRRNNRFDQNGERRGSADRDFRKKNRFEGGRDAKKYSHGPKRNDRPHNSGTRGRASNVKRGRNGRDR